MGFLRSARDGFAKYFHFNGRSSRKDFWYFKIFLLLIAFLVAIPDGFFFPGTEPLSIVFNVATICPSLAIMSRRLRDSGHTMYVVLFPIWDGIPFTLGLWLGVAFLAYAGTAFMLAGWLRIYYLPFVQKGDAGENNYGPSPLAAPEE